MNDDYDRCEPDAADRTDERSACARHTKPEGTRANPHELLPTTEARRLLGGVSRMFLYRRLRDDPSFPRPIRYAPRGPRFWPKRELLAWIDAHRAKS